MKIKSTLISALALAAFAISGQAQHMVPYVSAIGNEDSRGLDREWTVINANEDSKKWSYSDRDAFKKTEFGVGALYERSLESPIPADDWLVSPAIYLEEGKMYKVSWLVLTDGFSESYEVVMGEGATLEAMKSADAKQLFEVSKYMNYTNFEKKSVAITSEKTGEFNFGFHVYSPVTGYRLFLTGFEIVDYKLTPSIITDLTATNEGEEMKVTLNWVLPATDDTGGALNSSDITTVKIYRNEELIATLAGNATNYVDEAITEPGYYDYSVAAVAQAEGAPATVTTHYVGKLSALPLPFESDFTNTEAVDYLWTFIDANGDDLTWKQWGGGYGTYYIYYPNMRSDTVEDDWVISPALNFPVAGTYPMVWTGYGYHGNLEFWLMKGTSTDSREARIGVLTRDDLSTFSPQDKNFQITVQEPGNYNIGIHCNNNPTVGIEYYMYGLKVDKASGINSIAEDGNMENAAIYDMLGNRVTAPQPGSIYIVNGKKIIFK